MPPRPARTDREKTARLGFALLLACARRQISQQGEDEIKALVRAGIAWKPLLLSARRHGVMPLVYWHLHSTCPQAVPLAILNELHGYFLANSKRNLLLLREMARLLGLLEANVIPVIAFKGPLLGAVAYGNVSLRSSADVDILVRKQDFLRLKKLLLAEGYLPSPSVSRIPERALLDYAPECQFIRSPTGIELDVHWHMLPRMISYALDSEQLWQRVEYLPLAGMHVPTIPPEDMLLVLSVHGSKHLWERLGWICDIGGLIGVHRLVNWTRVLEQAGTQGSSRMLFLGLTLARDLVGAELPTEVSVRMQTDPEVDALACQVREWLANDAISHFGLRERMAFHLRVTERVADKLRYFSRLAMVPTVRDLQLWTSSQTPGFFYYLIRPFRLLAKYGRRALAALFRLTLFRRL